METRVQIEDKYKIKLHLKRKISKLVNLLFEIDEIKNNSAIKGFEIDTIAFDIVLTDDKEIHSINKTYRNKDNPTDVITFALFADDDNKFVFDKTVELGEIIISVDTAKRQAKETLKKEILTLIVHGIMHVLGFDHQTNKDYNFVFRVQDSVINGLRKNISLLWKMQEKKLSKRLMN